MLKNLVKDLKPSSTLLINETSRKLEEQGKKIYKFGFGQSPFKVPEDVVRELKIMHTKINICQCKVFPN
jgi:aspartate aminotransferase